MNSVNQQEPPNISEGFYREHADRYAEVSHQMLQSVYIKSSHPRLTGDLDLLARLKELVPSGSGLDAGCGAGARDVFSFWQEGCDIYGVDAIEENLRVAKTVHPEISDRLSVADLREPLDLDDDSFDFVMCNAVIQHIAPEYVMQVTLKEFARGLKPGGLMQLMFKTVPECRRLSTVITVWTALFCSMTSRRSYLH